MNESSSDKKQSLKLLQDKAPWLNSNKVYLPNNLFENNSIITPY